MTSMRGPARHVWALTCVLAAALGLANGCSTEARYQVLTVFFTGVPAPGEEEVKGKHAKKPAEVAAPSKRPRREFFQEPQFFVHGPYGAGQCDKCHALVASKPFRAEAPEAIKATPASERKSIGPRLAAPLKEICLTCHGDKAHTVAQAQGLWMHGPVADGWCVACHSPHRAARQYMLLGKNNVELCTGCHRKPDLLQSAAHHKEPEADCLACHNPHQGKNASLLKAEHDEWHGYGKGG